MGIGLSAVAAGKGRETMTTQGEINNAGNATNDRNASAVGEKPMNFKRIKVQKREARRFSIAMATQRTSLRHGHGHIRETDC